MPAAFASSNAYWMSGLSTTVSISFAIALVAGRMRVPSPATGNTALRTGLCMVLLDGRGASNKLAPSPLALTHKWRRTSPPPSDLYWLANAYVELMLEQSVARAIDLGGEIIGAAVVGMELHHQPVMRRLDRRLIGAGFEAEDFIGLRDRHTAAACARRRAGLAATEGIAPLGMLPVEIGFEQPRAVLVRAAALAQQRQEVGKAQLVEPHP